MRISIIIFLLSIIAAAHCERVIEITLKEYLHQVRENYQAIKIAKKEVDIALARFHEFRDENNSPFFIANYGFSKTTNREEVTVSPFRIDSSISHLVEGSYNHRFLETGTGVNLGFSYSSSEIVAQSLGTMFDYMNYENKLALGLTQSLLRNGPLGLSGKKLLEVNKTSVKLARSVFNSQLEQYLLFALQQYFSYELTKQSIDLSIQTLYDSEKILRQNQQKVKLGTADITSVYDSQILVIQNREEILKSKNTLLDIAENLLNLMGATSANREEVTFNFLTKLETKVGPIDVERVYSNAQQKRKDLEQAKLNKKLKKLNLGIAKLAQMPLLDLSLEMSYQASTTNSSAGSNPFSSEIFNNTFNGEPDINVGLRFEMPLDRRSFKTITERAKAEYRQAQQTLDKLNADIKLTLNKLLRQIDYLGKRVEESKLALDIQTKNVREYKRNLDIGKIDLQRYIASLDQLRTRRALYLQSVFDYESARAELQVAQGTFLLYYGIRELPVKAKVK